MRSAWKDHEIVFDGKNKEWQKAMHKERNVAFGAFNDDQNLYLCMSITDRVTKAQVMGLFKQDFYVWVDTWTGMEFQRQRKFGVRFSNDSAFMNADMLLKTRYLQVHSFQVIADEMMSHLTIQVMKRFHPVASLAEAKGIDANIMVFKDGRQLVYELKLPLEESPEHPYAIGVKPGTPIYVGLETSPIDVLKLENELRLEESKEMENSDRREMMVGGARMGRIMTAEQRKDFETEIALDNFRPISVWCRIFLAKKS